MEPDVVPSQQPTSISKSIPEMEEATLDQWLTDHTFEQSLQQTKDGQPYVFYDGPPFATGLPHYGSILPSVLKDVFPRFQTMQGRFVRRRWGWDCHGLPIENIVEQHLHISGKKQIEEIGVDRFNRVCRENILKYAHDWKTTIDRVARWVEFDSAYMTMHNSYMESVWWALQQIWKKGLIYEDRKVLLYCSRCETPVSNFEVAMDNSYKDITEESVYVKFKLKPRQRIIDSLTTDTTYVLAWTTTPWTLPGNTALNIGPDSIYVLVEQGSEHYILAKDRLSILEGPYEIRMEFAARSIEGLEYEPLFAGVIPNPEGKAHRIYIEDYVTTADGTGVVHNAAMYGEVDYEAAKKRSLPRVAVLDNKGQYNELLPEHLRGLFFKDADPRVLQDLRARGLVYRSEPYTHSYPFCWRCGTPLFYNALSAWFINIQQIKQRLLEENEKITWYPEHLKYGRFQKGIESAPDWNISRNRYWATPLPFWKCTNQACKSVTCIGSIEELKTKSVNFSDVYPQYDGRIMEFGVDDIETIDLHRPYIDHVVIGCQECGGEAKRIPEVVDCWVESGSMPFAELHYPFENKELFTERFPSDFVVEYIPQTRAWFYVMHVIAIILFDRAPFRTVLTTGTILAEDGTKMSKSKNNYPDPALVINTYGADALRFYLLTSPVVNGEDMNFSEKQIDEANKKIVLIVQNLVSFFRLYKKEAVSSTLPESHHPLDLWVLGRLSQTHTQVTEYLSSYNSMKAGKTLQDFLSDVSTWYLRRSRDRIKKADAEAQVALGVFGFVLAETTKMLAPFMPFIAERSFQELTGGPSVHLQAWRPTGFYPLDEKLLDSMELVRQISSVGLALRKQSALPVRKPLARIAIKLRSAESISGFESLVLEELNVKALVPYESVYNQAGVMEQQAENGNLVVLLDTVVTPELKREGYARELERQIQDLRKKSGLIVGDLVDLYYNTQDPELETALVEHIDRKKTFVNQVSKSFEVEVDYEIQADIDNKAVWLGLIKL